MYLRDQVKSLWRAAGLYDRPDARLQSFLAAIDQFPLECWDDFATRFRQNYYDLFDQLIPPLVHSNDPLLQVLLIRQSDLRQPKELAIAVALARSATPLTARPQLTALLHRNHPKITSLLRKRVDVIQDIDPPPPIPRATGNQVPVDSPRYKAAVAASKKRATAT